MGKMRVASVDAQAEAHVLLRLRLGGVHRSPFTRRALGMAPPPTDGRTSQEKVSANADGAGAMVVKAQGTVKRRVDSVEGGFSWDQGQTRLRLSGHAVDLNVGRSSHTGGR